MNNNIIILDSHGFGTNAYPSFGVTSPTGAPPQGQWILTNGIWDDSGIWDDTNYWID